MSDDLIKRSDALSAAGDMSYIAFEIRKKLRMIPSVESITVTTEEAIEHLQKCGWLPEHDRILTEPKSGEWIFVESKISDRKLKKCSVCGLGYVSLKPDNYCPNCGARMSNASNASNTLETLEKGETE